MQTISTCIVENCERKHYGKGYCSAHWKRIREQGSVNSEKPIIIKIRHGLRSRHNTHPLYSTWHNMRQRCNNPRDKDYSRYGARGIRVCERWDNFALFLEDMGTRTEGMTLDRIDNNGDYEPKNCRWVTPKEQTQNSRVAKLNIQKVKEIRQLYARGGITHNRISNLYNVDQSLISRIVNNKIW